MTENIFLPSNPQNIKQKDIARYLENIEIEIANGIINQKETQLITQPTLMGKYLNKKSRPFFQYHFLPLWEIALRVLFQKNANPRIVELGCATGTSSILCALLGAKVLGIDLNSDLVNICNNRKRFYQNYMESIDVEFIMSDTFDFSFDDYSPVDAFLSLFAFNLMKPCDVLLAKIIPCLKRGGRIVIIDGNSGNIYKHFLPSRRRPGILSPVMMKEKLEALGCKILLIETFCAIPPFIFRYPRLSDIAIKSEEVLRRMKLHKHFGVSYIVVAEKKL